MKRRLTLIKQKSINGTIHIVLLRRSVLQAQTTLLQWFISGVADYQAVPPPPPLTNFISQYLP